MNPPGDERPLAEFFVGELRRAGLAAELIPTPDEASAPGRAAAWGWLPGSGGRPPLVLLSHLDVVPAEAAAWDFDPFQGARSGEFVVGRGALDAKGISVVHLLTLAELKRRERPLRRDLIFLATPDEETGGQLGAGYLASARPDLLRGARYLLTEGGSIAVAGPGQPALWGVTVTEKSPCWLRLEARGASGHSSAAPFEAAVPRLVAALGRALSVQTPIRVVPEVARMYAALAPGSDPDDRAGFSDLAQQLAKRPAFRARFLARPEHETLVRDTFTITLLEAGQRTNVVPGAAVAHIDARLLPEPGASCEAFAGMLQAVIADPGIGVSILLSYPSRSAPVDTPLFRAIELVAERSDPGAIVVPRVITGFTDAHYFRELGLVAYGFTPRWIEAAEARGIHGPNERISVGNLVRGVETLIAILDELDKLD